MNSASIDDNNDDVENDSIDDNDYDLVVMWCLMHICVHVADTRPSVAIGAVGVARRAMDEVFEGRKGWRIGAYQ